MAGIASALSNVLPLTIYTHRVFAVGAGLCASPLWAITGDCPYLCVNHLNSPKSQYLLLSFGW